MSRKEPLQRCIIMYLTRTEPQTIRQIAKGISKDYKSSWVAFKKLKRKDLVKKVGKKYHQRSQYPTFWLTEMGILQALGEGANPEHLLNQTLEVYPQNRNLQFFIEAALIFGGGIAYIFGSDILGDPEEVETNLIEFLSTELINIINHMPETQEPHAQEQITKFRALLKRYPELYRRLPNELEQYAEELKKLAHVLQQERSGE